MTSSTSRSRPTSGSSFPWAASSVRFRPSCESQGKSRGIEGVGRGGAACARLPRRGRGRGGGRGRRGSAREPRPGPPGTPRPCAPARRGARSRACSSAPRLARLARPASAGRGGAGAAGAARAHLDRLQLAQPPRHAGGEVGEGHVAQAGELQPAGAQELVGRGGAHPAHGDEQVEAVHLGGPDAGSHVAGALAQVAGHALRLPGRPGHGLEDPVLVDAPLAQQDLGAVRDGEEGEELVSAGELLVDAACDVLGLGEDLQRAPSTR